MNEATIRAQVEAGAVQNVLLIADGAIVHVEIVTQMQNRYLEDKKYSVEITLRNWQQHPWLLRLLGWISRFLRNWL